MMWSLYTLLGRYDPIVSGLAIVVCAVGSITSIEVFCRAAKNRDRVRAMWLAIGALAGGFGIWAANAVAMLAFSPSAASNLQFGPIGASLLIVMGCTGLGFTIATSKRFQDAALVGGGVVGAGIAAMHFVGMAGLEIGEAARWSPLLHALSIILAPLFGALSLSVSRYGNVRHQLLGSLLLFFAICSHHFITTAALMDVAHVAASNPATAVSRTFIAVGVAAASLLVLLLACALLTIDFRDSRKAALEAERLQSLANVAVEGLVICRNGRIITVNRAFAKLVGSNPSSLNGRFIEHFVPLLAEIGATTNGDDCVETSLQHPSGASVPVEIIARPIAYKGEHHTAIAIRDISVRRRDAKQIQFLAHHDPLTRLANRTLFNESLEQELLRASIQGSQVAVLCLDLDRFKEVNDLFGHAAGDAMLRRVSDIVTGLLSPGQMMARLGGDEFAVIAPCDQPGEAGELAERILVALRAGNAEASGPMIATSIGIAVYPNDGTEAQTILVNADTALYRAKSEGRGIFRYFEFRMGREVRERRLLEHDLRSATARGEMQIVYQPQMDAATSTIAGFEALLRWNHPQRGPISPATFVPLAEESEIILQLGEWVLRQACEEAATWQEPLSIGVNVSGVQLYRTDFANLVEAVLHETGLAPERLELEITESALIREPARALATLKQLKRLGVRIAMDDFGVGYSSLSNLRSFPLDRIKIDGSFIRQVDSNPQAAAIVRSVIELGRGLSLPVVAEGVETEAELAFLQSERCGAIQGFLIGRPSSMVEINAHARRGKIASRAA